MRLVEEAERLQDVLDYDAAKASLERGEEELVPSEVVYAILDGDNPIRVWREYRHLSTQQLAEAARIGVSDLAEIETSQPTGTPEVLTAIAKALQVPLDEIAAVPCVRQSRRLLAGHKGIVSSDDKS